MLTGDISFSINPEWSELGPTTLIGGGVDGIPDNPVSGALQAFVRHPTEPDTAYVGSVNGGIWRTPNIADANVDWDPLTDETAALSISSLAFSPNMPNVLYAGIGAFSSFAGFGSQVAGLLRSTQYGDVGTWEYLKGDTTNDVEKWPGLAVAKVLPTPFQTGDEDIVLVATTKPTLNSVDPNNTKITLGLWISKDGGANFDQLSGNARLCLKTH